VSRRIVTLEVPFSCPPAEADGATSDAPMRPPQALSSTALPRAMMVHRVKFLSSVWLSLLQCVHDRLTLN
jgi:hypothetical protein